MKIVDLIKDPIDLLVNLIVIVIVCSVNSENSENSLGSVKCGATSISDGIFRYQYPGEMSLAATRNLPLPA